MTRDGQGAASNLPGPAQGGRAGIRRRAGRGYMVGMLKWFVLVSRTPLGQRAVTVFISV